MRKKKKKTDRRSRFQLKLVEVVGLLPWPKHWGMESRKGARMFRLTSKPSTVTIDIFDGAPGAFTSDHNLPNVFSMELAMQDAKVLAEKILEAAAASRTLTCVWKTQ